MAIRIWHQSFTVLSDLAAYDEALKDHFRRVARPDTVIDMHGMREGTYRSNYPGDDIKHVGFQFLHSIQFLQGALLAERQGYDAYALSTLPEPGLREIRALVTIPVVGYGECAARAAVGDGRKFGALVFIPELAELYPRQCAPSRPWLPPRRCRRRGLSFHRCIGRFRLRPAR